MKHLTTTIRNDGTVESVVLSVTEAELACIVEVFGNQAVGSASELDAKIHLYLSWFFERYYEDGYSAAKRIVSGERKEDAATGEQSKERGGA